MEEKTNPSSGPMIPGERERNTLTTRLPGSIGGPEFGSDVDGTPNVLMDDVTIAEHQREGGGARLARTPRTAAPGDAAAAPGRSLRAPPRPPPITAQAK